MNSSGSGPRSPPDPLVSPRGRESRALVVGLFASALVHLAILLMWTSFSVPFNFVAPVGDGGEAPEPRLGMDIVVILETGDTPTPSQLEPIPEPQDPSQAVPAVLQEPADPGAQGQDTDDDEAEAEPGLSVAERLRPRMIDPRLWAPVDPRHTELSDVERAEIMLRGMIQSWNDSLAVAEALSDRATDWTYTDSEGRRWGLAPGRLHLGDFSIPLPLAFEVPAHLRQEWAQRQWVLDDLNRGAINAQIQETWADRARMIRARMEAERSGGTDPGSDGGGR